MWDGSWNNELEESVLNLLVALDDAFQPSASGGLSARNSDELGGDATVSHVYREPVGGSEMATARAAAT